MQSTSEDVTQETPVTAAPRADAEAPGEAEPERETGPPPTGGTESPITATTAVVTSPDAVPPGGAASEPAGVGLPAVAVLLVVAALVGAAVVALVQRARSRAGADPSGPAADPADERPVDPLARAAIDVRDRVGNPALAERLAAGLAATGWTTVDPTGDRFDPTRHVAVDRETTGDAGLGGVIAAVERVGYVGPDGEVVRPPEVVVYAYAAGGAS